jgi:hypothetical protein
VRKIYRYKVTLQPENSITNSIVDDMSMRMLESELAVAHRESIEEGSDNYHHIIPSVPTADTLKEMTAHSHGHRRRGNDPSVTRPTDEGDEHDTTRFEGYGTRLKDRSREWTKARDAVGFFLYTCSTSNEGSHMAGGGNWPLPKHMSMTSICNRQPVA